MNKEEQTSWAVRQLTDKQTETGRLPLKNDFDEKTLSRIKAFLGPWPRALEKAGLKEKKESKKNLYKRKTRTKEN